MGNGGLGNGEWGTCAVCRVRCCVVSCRVVSCHCRCHGAVKSFDRSLVSFVRDTAGRTCVLGGCVSERGSCLLWLARVRVRVCGRWRERRAVSEQEGRPGQEAPASDCGWMDG
jgi:hypothetical protein